MFEFVTGCPPFIEDTPEQIFANIINRGIGILHIHLQFYCVVIYFAILFLWLYLMNVLNLILFIWFVHHSIDLINDWESCWFVPEMIGFVIVVDIPWPRGDEALPEETKCVIDALLCKDPSGRPKLKGSKLSFLETLPKELLEFFLCIF